MSASNFAPALALVLSYEGGFSDLSSDPGGCTNLGVTQASLSEYRGRACTVADVRDLTRADVTPIYRAHYWDAMACDSLPVGVDLVCFDGAVNQGPGAMARMLQRAAGVVVDGQLGARTLYAIAAVSPAVMVDRIRRQRLAAYQASSDFRIFGAGWTRRLSGVAQTATSWAVKAAPSTPAPMKAEAPSQLSQAVEVDL